MKRFNLKIFRVSFFLFYVPLVAFVLAQKEPGSQSKLDSLLKTIKVNPTAEAYYSLGEIYIDQKQLEEAKQQFILCIQIDVNSPFRTQAHLKIGKIYYLLQDYPKAVRETRKALEREPELAAALNIMNAAQNMEAAENAFAENDLLKAEIHYRRVIQIDATNPLARQRLNTIQNRNLAESMIKNAQEALNNQQFDKAQFYLEDAEKCWPGHPLLNSLKALIEQNIRTLDSTTRTESLKGTRLEQIEHDSFPKTNAEKIQPPDSAQIQQLAETSEASVLDSLPSDTSQIDSAGLRIEDKITKARDSKAAPYNQLWWIAIGVVLIIVSSISLKLFQRHHRKRVQVKEDRAEYVSEKPIPRADSEKKKSRAHADQLSNFIGKYEIIERLTKGGMGEVVKARHPHFQKPVVIKTILPELTHVTTFRQRLIREATILFELDHPNIVRVYDLLEEKDQIYIVMQFIEGKNLKEKLEAEGFLEQQKALNYFIQTCHALNYLHERKIIHRDIKPQNIMVETGTDRVKLVDFGIVKPLDSEVGQTLTSSSRIVGTPNYMSPEQLLNDDVDHRTDIFSLGIVFFKALTGKHPFDTPDMSITRAILEKAAPLITDINPTLDQSLVTICERMLAKDRNERYHSIQAIVHDLELLLI